MNRVNVSPELLSWARERSGRSLEDLTRRFAKLELWEQGEAAPTFKQLEDFAKATYTPIGFFFLQSPPVEHVPIPDLRTVGNEHIAHPSPDLLDIIYLCQQRQEWYREFARATRQQPRSFVGSVSVGDDVEATAAAMREALGFDLEERRDLPTWLDALRRFIELVDKAGVLVMISGVVGSNTHRKLDPQEFRGFALADDLAPAVFINGSDSKAAQMFTLAHELSHIWTGESALSDVGPLSVPSNRTEVWCNKVAAEFLVPLAAIMAEYRGDAAFGEELKRLATCYKVSRLVILRRLFDARMLTREQFEEAYGTELARIRSVPRSPGGDFYLSMPVKIGRRFARALVASTLEGHSSFTEAFRLLGIKKMATFNELGHTLGVII